MYHSLLYTVVQTMQTDMCLNTGTKQFASDHNVEAYFPLLNMNRLDNRYLTYNAQY